MTLYFDLDTGVFCSGPGTRDTVSSLSFKRGDTVQIALRFVSGIVVQELAAGATGQIGLKAVGDYDGSFVASATSWTKVGTGTATVYNFTLDLNTVPLDTLLGVGAPADIASVPLNFELEFVASGVRTSSNTVTATIHNDVIRGDESTPTPLPDIIGTTTPTQPVAGTQQIERMLPTGVVTVAGNAVLTITAAGLSDSPRTYSIPLSVDDTPTVMIAACKAALAADSAVMELFSIGSTLFFVELRAKSVLGAYPANDSTLEMTFSPGSSVGPGSVTSTTYVEGVAGTPGTITPPYIRVADGFLYIQEAGTWKKVALSAL